MATIYNSKLSKELIDGAGIQTSREVVPNQIAEKVVPVMEVNPKLLRSINIIKSVTAAGAIYTAPADKDFYLTNCSINGFVNIANQTSGCTITAIPLDGTVNTIAIIRLVTTTLVDAMAGNVVTTFNPPIKIKKSSAVTLVNANMSALSANICGYIVDETL